MKVTAIKDGYYDNKRRKEGSTFHLKNSEKEFSENWMEKVNKETAKKSKKSKKPRANAEESNSDADVI